jgi:protein SCO1/2
MMSRSQKIFATSMWLIALVALIGVVTANVLAKRRGAQQPSQSQQVSNLPDQPEVRLPQMFEVPDFSLTDQNGATLKRDDLKGRVWVAAFIFTNCPGICPMMTSKMAALEQAVTDPQVHLVSMSLDPERDTPAVLKQYAAKMKADEKRWHFLTGDKAKIYEIAKEMKVAAVAATDTTPIVHSENLILVDQTGHIRGYYKSTQEEDMKRLATDASDLSAGKVPAGGA